MASVTPASLSARRVGAELRRMVDGGVEIRAAGMARRDPRALLSQGYTPKHRLRLFDTTYYLSNLRFDINFRFYVAFVFPERPGKAVYPRIFYKDQSLVWRCGTHLIRSETENWIGKGDLKRIVKDGEALYTSAEETTDLPYEIQDALDVISRRDGKVRRDEQAVHRVLRKAPDDRYEPYRDFHEPRRRAAADRRNRVHGGRYVAWFERANDPTSLRFAPGFEPDFTRGLLETHRSRSRLYGGAIRKYRILSRNRTIQYLFIAAPKLVWIIPPQALTTEIMSYGVRTIDVHADEDLFLPGYEYHFMDESQDPPALYSQIPVGFAGAVSEVDPSRRDASPWLDRLPVVREFRRKVLDAAPPPSA